MAVTSVSFLAPQDQLTLQLQQEQSQRQQALADALRQRSVTPLPTNQGPISPWQGIAQLAQAIAANHINRNAMAAQYDAASNATNSQARSLGATGNVVDPNANPYRTSENGRNIGQRIGDFIRGGAPIAPHPQPAAPIPAPNIPQAVAPSQAAPVTAASPSTPALPAPSSPGAVAAPPAVSPNAVGGQPPVPTAPMQGIMAPPSLPPQAAAPAAPQMPVQGALRSPLALTPDWRTNMALANANGEKYSEALISQNTPVAPAQMMAQAQAALARGDTATASVILGQLHKDQYIAPATFRGGSYSQDQNTGLTTYHAALPEGSQPTMNADGSVASVAPIPGAAGVESAMAGAKAGATAAATTPYQLTQVLGPDGNYHSVPVSSLTGGAPGAGPTASGGLNGFYGHASQGGTPVPAGYTPAPAGNVTGLGPGQQSATTTAGKNSANAFQGAIDGGNNAKNAMRGIDNILTAATGLQTGTGAGAISEFKSGMNVVLPKSMQFDTRNIAAFDEIKKNAASLGDQLSQSIGGGTDSRLKNALDSLPNANYSPAAIQEVGLNLKALQSAALGRAQAAAAWQQSHGAESYPAFQQAWQNAYNPDVFYYMQKGPQAFQKWAGSMSAPARAKALDQYRTMKTLGAF